MPVLATASRGALVVVDLSRNFGKEAALSARLHVAAGDAVIDRCRSAGSAGVISRAVGQMA